MKRLFSAIAFAALVAMCLVACNQNEVKLHQAVGTVYGKATDSMGGDGIVFYVNEGAGYALVCSMTDLKRDRQKDTLRDHIWETDFTWSVFGTDTVMERDTIWCKLTRTFKHFIDTTHIDSILPTSIVDETVPFTRYNYEERDSIVTIYPMLRYKAYTEKGVQVCPPFTKDTAYNGFIGELISADTVVKSVRVEKFIGDTTWNDDTVIINKQKYAIKVNGKFEKDSSVTIYRPYADTVERRTKAFAFIAAGYSDTNVNAIRKGDRKYPNSNEWEYALDTNWSYSRIGIGEEDPDGKVNTNKILNADVPCRQKATPDSSSAARTCYTYFTKNYYENRGLYKADTTYEAGQGEWFLPSRAELRHLFDAKTKINEMNANTIGFEPLQNCYWSSNERDAKTAWYKCFSDNGVESYIPKANNNYRVNIRAVRQVKWPEEK